MKTFLRLAPIAALYLLTPQTLYADTIVHQSGYFTAENGDKVHYTEIRINSDGSVSYLLDDGFWFTPVSNKSERTVCNSQGVCSPQ